MNDNRELIEILLVEDPPGDAHLVAEVLKESKVSNKLYHVEDGVEALLGRVVCGSRRRRMPSR